MSLLSWALLAVGAVATWRLYDGGIGWWWTALVATLAWLWSVGIAWNYRHDPGLPFYVAPLGTVAALAVVGLLVASFVVT